MSPGSNTVSYPTFARIWLRENPGKNLNQVACPDRESNPGHLVSRLNVLTVKKGNSEGGGFGPVLWIEFGVAQWSERLVRRTKDPDCCALNCGIPAKTSHSAECAPSIMAVDIGHIRHHICLTWSQATKGNSEGGGFAQWSERLVRRTKDPVASHYTERQRHGPSPSPSRPKATHSHLTASDRQFAGAIKNREVCSQTMS
ncbi:hypothetical protein ANN_22418 [Periplaneta americana]|uniref:Uncharacterized protein n=1 Tax=Periplaneta americana TaxID=6978 RepID=A0ABQ8S8E3_PERAM|nr:hypothetical protein ANN_22418 [Periplaneta americana]